jgi:type I restriction enzyme S subunit
MNEWARKTIAECAADEPYSTQIGPFGKALTPEEYTSSGVPLLRGINVNYGRFYDDGFVFISEETANRLSKYESYPDDILLVHKGTLGQIGLMPKNRKYHRYIMGNSMLRVRCDETKLIPEYLYYWLCSREGQHYLFSRVSQVGVPQIQKPLATLREASLPVPPLDEQKAITHILGTLDNKIDNLRQQNETLEAIAQTLFKHWFVDFEFPNKDGKPYKSSGGAIERSELGEFPVGWQVRRFDSLGELNRGKSKHRPRDAKHLYGGKYPFIQTGDIKSSQGFITEYKQTYSESGLAQSRLWKKETLCITIAANIAETGILTFPSCFPDSVIGFVADSNICDIFFIHRMFKFKRPEIENEAIGSVQKNLNLETITKIKFVIPNLKNNEDLVKIFRKFGERIIANKQQIQTLTKTRNVLLPQLMSGKLRITE